MAGADALAGFQVGRTWVVPADDLDELIVAVNLERCSTPPVV